MIAMMSVSVRLSRDSSVTINVSPDRIFPSNGPSFLSFSFLRPLTTSVTQRSTTMPPGGGEPPDFVLLVRQILLPSAHSQIGNYHGIRYDHSGSVHRRRTDYSKLRAK